MRSPARHPQRAWLPLLLLLNWPALGAPQTDWARRYRLTRVSVIDFAQERPSAALVTSNETGLFQLYAWDLATGKRLQLTHEPTGKSGGEISPDGRWVYYLKDTRGSEVGSYVRVPFTGGSEEEVMGNLPPYSGGGIAFDRDGRFLVFSHSDDKGFRFTRWEGPSGKRQLYESENEAYDPSLSADGKYLALSQTERKNDRHYALSLLDAETGKRLAELWDGEPNSVTHGPWSPRRGDARVLINSDKTGFWRPGIYDLAEKKRSDFQIDMPGSITAQDWTPDGQKVVLRQELDGRARLFLYAPVSGRLTPITTPVGFVGGAWVRPDGKVWTTYQSAATTPRLLEIDLRTGKSVVRLASEAAPPGTPLRSIRYAGARGDGIQAFLGVPRGRRGAAIVYVHGGPKATTADTFSPSIQGLLDAGYVVLAPNYHGSSGFGRDFSESILGDPMHLELEDFAAARRYLLEKGLASQGRVFVTGWSYGGYSTLSCLTRQPEDWAGGVAGIAIADMVLQYEDARAPLRGWTITNFGGTPDEKRDLYLERSPITYAQNLKAPLLIIQGKNDRRTPARQMQEFAKKLSDLQKNFAIEWFDAGHGSLSVAESIAHEKLAIDFFDHVVGESKLAGSGRASAPGAAP